MKSMKAVGEDGKYQHLVKIARPYVWVMLHLLR